MSNYLPKGYISLYSYLKVLGGFFLLAPVLNYVFFKFVNVICEKYAIVFICTSCLLLNPFSLMPVSSICLFSMKFCYLTFMFLLGSQSYFLTDFQGFYLIFFSIPCNCFLQLFKIVMIILKYIIRKLMPFIIPYSYFTFNDFAHIEYFLLKGMK